MDKLSKVLSDLAPKQKIKIGSNGGSSWFYMGTPEDFEWNLLGKNQLMEAMWRKRVQLAKENLDLTIKGVCSMESYIRQALKHTDPDLSLKGYNAFVEHSFRRILAENRRVQKLEYILETVKPFQNRDVVEVFQQDPAVDTDYICIRIEGYENGVFWMESDAKTLPAFDFGTALDEDDLEDIGA